MNHEKQKYQINLALLRHQIGHAKFGNHICLEFLLKPQLKEKSGPGAQKMSIGVEGHKGITAYCYRLSDLLDRKSEL